jgi:hypothetical protein
MELVGTVRKRRLRAVAGAVGYCAGLAAVSLAGLVAVAVGRAGLAAAWSGRWQRRLGDPVPQPDRALPVFGNAVVGLLLGVLALLPLGVEVLLVARGALYGLVDRGPYDHSWGGPTRSGAWLAHFLVALPFGAAGLVALYGLARLHRRWTARLAGQPGAAWTLPVILAAGAAGTALFIAWLHQI